MKRKPTADAYATAEKLLPVGSEKDFPILASLALLVPGLARDVAELLARAYRAGQASSRPPTTWRRRPK